MRIFFATLIAPALLMVGPALAQTDAPAAPKVAPGTTAPAMSAPGAAAVANEVPESTVVLTVNGQTLTRAQYEDMLKAMPENIRSQAMGPAKRQMAEQVAELEALADQAKKDKIDERPAVKEITKLQVDKMLAGFLYQDLIDQAKPTDAMVNDYYEKHKSEYEEARVRHILVRYKGSRVPLKKDAKDLTPEEALAKAQDLRKQLLAGTDFATLAKAESDDTQSAAEGGDMGYASLDRYVPEFAKAARDLPVGQVSEPVKTAFGYHLIKVEDRRAKPVESVRAKIEETLKTSMAQKKVEEIRDGAGTEINEAYFGKPKVAPPALTNAGGSAPSSSSVH